MKTTTFRFILGASAAFCLAAWRNAIPCFENMGNYDYQSDTPNGWPKKNGSQHVWEHSDIKNVPFFYVYPVFEKIKDLR